MAQTNQTFIKILPDNRDLQVELDSSTTIYELMEYIMQEFKYVGDIIKWTCFSNQRQKYLNHQEQIGNYQNENLIINTQPQPNLSSEFQKIEEIILQIHIADGKIERGFQATFKTSNTLQEVASTILSYCQLQESLSVATVDLFLFNQPYNDNIKRQKSLSDLQIKNNTTISAKIRWIGG